MSNVKPIKYQLSEDFDIAIKKAFDRLRSRILAGLGDPTAGAAKVFKSDYPARGKTGLPAVRGRETLDVCTKDQLSILFLDLLPLLASFCPAMLTASTVHPSSGNIRRQVITQLDGNQLSFFPLYLLAKPSKRLLTC